MAATVCDLLVVDVSSVRFRRVRQGSLLLLTGDGERLAELPDAPVDDREAAARLLDVCAATSLVLRHGRWCRVGFYHPATTQVGVGAHPSWAVFRCPAPVGLPFEGLCVSVDGAHLVTGSGEVFASVDEPLDVSAILTLAAASDDLLTTVRHRR